MISDQPPAEIGPGDTSVLIRQYDDLDESEKSDVNKKAPKRKLLCDEEVDEDSRADCSEDEKRRKCEDGGDLGEGASCSSRKSNIENQNHRSNLISPKSETYVAEERVRTRASKNRALQVLNKEMLQYEQAKILYDNGCKLIEDYQKRNSKPLNGDSLPSNSKPSRNAKSNASLMIAHQSGNMGALLDWSRNHDNRNLDGDGTNNQPNEVSMINPEEIKDEENNDEDDGADVGEEAEGRKDENDEKDENEMDNTLVQARHENCIEAVGDLLFPRETDDPAHDYFVNFLGEKARLLEVILNKYLTFRETMELDPKNAAEHWSVERLSEKEHNRRFTRWDAAVANAVLKQTIDERKLYETNSYLFRKQSKHEYCATRAMKIERIINEPLMHDSTVFCSQQFSLMDIAERKSSSTDHLLFQKPISTYNKRKKEFIHRNQSKVIRALKAQNIPWQLVKDELQSMAEPNYRLPKGKVFCRLVLNVAELFYYCLYRKLWSFRMQGIWQDKKLFKGVPFDREGKLLQFQ